MANVDAGWLTATISACGTVYVAFVNRRQASELKRAEEKGTLDAKSALDTTTYQVKILDTKDAYEEKLRSDNALLEGRISALMLRMDTIEHNERACYERQNALEKQVGLNDIAIKALENNLTREQDDKRRALLEFQAEATRLADEIIELRKKLFRAETERDTALSRLRRAIEEGDKEDYGNTIE